MPERKRTPSSSAEPKDLEQAVVANERVFLRRPMDADQRELLRLRRSSWDFLAPWEPAPPKGRSPYGPRWFADYLASCEHDDIERFLLCLRTDGRLLGAINLSGIIRGAFHSAYIGYWIGQAHANQGLMGAGLELLVRHAFRTLRLHRLEANIRPENEPSIRLVRRLGFRLEGYSPRYLRIAGSWRDHERWAITREEWPPGASGKS